jgi:pilus assembly protein CpaC
MVTPHLAKPISPDDVVLPTDSFVEPGDWEFYWMGHLEGKRPEADAEPDLADDKGGIEGSYGQQVN